MSQFLDLKWDTVFFCFSLIYSPDVFDAVWSTTAEYWNMYFFAYPSRKQSLVFRSAKFDEVILDEGGE